MTKEGNHGALHVIGCEAEVRVGHDVARRGEHARILPVAQSLYKRVSPDELAA